MWGGIGKLVEEWWRRHVIIRRNNGEYGQRPRRGDELLVQCGQ